MSIVRTVQKLNLQKPNMIPILDKQTLYKDWKNMTIESKSNSGTVIVLARPKLACWIMGITRLEGLDLGGE